MADDNSYFQKQKNLLLTLFNFAFLFIFVYFLPSLISYRPHRSCLLSAENKRASVQNLLLSLRIPHELTGFDTGFSLKKKKFLVFVHIYRSFYRCKNHSANYRSQVLPLDNLMHLFFFWVFVANGFHDRKRFVFENKTKLFKILPFFSFLARLLPVLVHEKAYTTILAFDGGSIEQILRGPIWLYGFDSVFSQF